MDQANLQYRALLENEFTRRCKANARYSLRAFARDTGLSPSRVSLIFAGKQGLSAKAALRMAAKLGWGKGQGVYFTTLVEAAHARSMKKRSVARIRLREFDQNLDQKLLTADTIECLSHWYYGAILELLQIRGFDRNKAAIASSLAMSVTEISIAVERLVRLGLVVEKEGTFSVTNASLASTTDVPSSAVKEFHAQILAKAATALVTQPVEQREVSSVLLAIDKSRLPELKLRLRSLKSEFLIEAETSATKNSVYCFGLQFFRIDQEGKKP